MVSKFSVLSVWSLFFLLLLSASLGISTHAERGFVQPEIGFPVPTSLITIFFMVYLIVLMRRLPYPKFRLSIILLFFVFVFLSIASSLAEPTYAVMAIKWLVVQGSILLSLIFLATFYRRKNLPLFDHFLIFIVFFGAISLFFALLLFFTGSINVGFATMTQFPGYLRLYGWYGNPNLLGSTMGIALISSFVLIYRGRNRNITRLFMFFLMFSGVLLAASKTVIISLIVAFSAYFFFCKLPRVINLRTVSKKNLFVLLVLFVFMLFFAYFFVSYYPYFSALLTIESLGITGSGRTDIWRDSFTLYSQADFLSLLFGYGFGFHLDYFSKSAHSFYVKHIIESGLLFISFFLLVNFFITMKAIKDSYSSNSLLSSVAVFVFLVIVFMLFRNLGTPSFLQVRVENILYFATIIIYFGVRSKIISEGGLNQ